MTAHPVDIEIGRRITARRRELGFNQSQLAGALGLTFQQVQKYERGANRVSGSKLFEIARFLDVSPVALMPPVDWEVSPEAADAAPAPSRRAIDVMRLMGKMTAHQQNAVLQVARAIVGDPPPAKDDVE